jgi:hypothetical protein
LYIIECEASEDSQATPEPDVLGESKCSDRGGGKDERSKSGDGDERNTCEKGPTEVEVFFLLSSSSNKGDRAHHGNRVQTGTGNNCRGCHEEERGEECTLGSIESCPEGVFWNVAVSLSARILAIK